MENKYYIPEIEEFHVGFEYETMYLQDYDCWKKEVLTKEDAFAFFESYENDAVPTEFRVKHLNKEDIEELGWNQETYDTFITKNGNFALEFNPEYNTFIYRRNAFSDTVFKGKIKNKSELRKLIKQLNIE